MWLLALHNAVNERRGVPVWTVEQLEAAAAQQPVEAGREVAATALEAAAAAGVGAAAVAAGRALLVATGL
jgi:hypothetical protein